MFENNEWNMMSVILADMEQDKWVWIIGILAVLVLAAAAGVVLCKRFRKRYADDELDEMEGLDFEYYCAELLRNRGFIEVEVTKSSGDYGIDILAEKEGVTYAGRDFYDRMVGCVLTNQYFTQPAVDAAQKLKILLWDRDYLEEMIEEGC